MKERCEKKGAGEMCETQLDRDYHLPLAPRTDARIASRGLSPVSFMCHDVSLSVAGKLGVTLVVAPRRCPVL